MQSADYVAILSGRAVMDHAVVRANPLPDNDFTSLVGRGKTLAIPGLTFQMPTFPDPPQETQ